MAFGWPYHCSSNLRQSVLARSSSSRLPASRMPFSNSLRRVHSGSSSGRTGPSIFLSKHKTAAMTTGALCLLAATGSSSNTWAATNFRNHSSTMSTATLCEPDEETMTSVEDRIPVEWCTYDSYNGVIVQLPDSVVAEEEQQEYLERNIRNSMNQWKADGKRGIWIHANPKHHVQLFPFLVKEFGFNFHQFSPDKKKVVLTKWLPTDQENKLPFGPTHQVGVGIIVFHPEHTRKMLVVQEKSGPASKVKLWKMPTGLVDPGEDISDAALRELQEETGINWDYQFQKIVGFRQAHSSTRPSDLFFLCTLQLIPPSKSNTQTNVHSITFQPQESEIADIKWMDVDDFMNQPFWKDSPIQQQMHKVLQTIKDDKSSSVHDDIGFVSKKLQVGYRPGVQTLYVHENGKSKL